MTVPRPLSGRVMKIVSSDNRCLRVFDVSMFTILFRMLGIFVGSVEVIADLL